MLDFNMKSFILVEDMSSNAANKGCRAALREGSVAGALFLDFCTVPGLLALRQCSKSLKWLVKKARLQVQISPDASSKVEVPLQVPSVVAASPILSVPVTITLDSLLWSLAHVREAGLLVSLNINYKPQCSVDIDDMSDLIRPKEVSVGGAAVLPSEFAPPNRGQGRTHSLHEGGDVQPGIPWRVLTSLRSLHLVGAVGVTHEDLHPLAGQLQRLELVHVPGVRDVTAFTRLLTLTALIEHELQGVHALAGCLQELTVVGGSLAVPLQLSSFQHLRSCVLRRCRAGDVRALLHTPPPSLTRLVIVHCAEWAGRSMQVEAEELYHLHHVQQLHLEGCVRGLVTRQALAPLAGACSQLTLLRAKLAPDALKALPKLRCLRMDGNTISYEHLVGSMPPSLRSLALQSCSLLGLPEDGPRGVVHEDARTLPAHGGEAEEGASWTVPRLAALAQCKTHLRAITAPLTVQAASRLFLLLLASVLPPRTFAMHDISGTGGQQLLPCTVGQGWESRIAEVQVTMAGAKRTA